MPRPAKPKPPKRAGPGRPPVGRNSERRRRFIEELIADPKLNGTQAAIRAGFSEKGAKQRACYLMKDPEIRAALQDAYDQRAARVQITADMVAQRWWQIATADPNELIQYRRLCCRFCHGVDHQFQWKDEAEWARAVASAQAHATEAKPADIPSNAGGYGFDKVADPNPECPGCDGEGVGEVHANDTRDLLGPAALLYAGVKVTKDGFEMKMQDQGAALLNVAKFLGMHKDKLELSGGLDVYDGMTVEQKRERAVALAKELGLAGVGKRD